MDTKTRLVTSYKQAGSLKVFEPAPPNRLILLYLNGQAGTSNYFTCASPTIKKRITRVDMAASDIQKVGITIDTK